VVAASDEEVFGLSYAQVALKVRPDVRVLNLLEWRDLPWRRQVLERVGINPSGLENLNRGELIGMIAAREPVWIIDPPMPPRPGYLANAPCIGPYTVLDLRRSAITSAKQENKPMPPPRDDFHPESMWLGSDQSLAEKYLSCHSL
jgi:hypothetical protein